MDKKYDPVIEKIERLIEWYRKLERDYHPAEVVVDLKSIKKEYEAWLIHFNT